MLLGIKTNVVHVRGKQCLTDLGSRFDLTVRYSSLLGLIHLLLEAATSTLNYGTFLFGLFTVRQPAMNFHKLLDPSMYDTAEHINGRSPLKELIKAGKVHS
ncbi:hypothetical protein QG37_00173 [Candidozyma auris]|uniref:Uncharacterized protein n=1 Tax=Candidozyma auris TaxID=498019 RepID=A0A0L0P984_CANAR|nr:hypothetical protein QG37_00173 [[Candida] auris]